MKIGIDASRAARKNRSGTENYSYYIIKYLTTFDLDDSFVLYSDQELPKELVLGFHENVEVNVMKASFLWSQFHLARQANHDRLDVLFIPAHVLPFLYRGKSVVTIHGLEYEKFREGYSFFERLYLKLMTKWALKRAKEVIVPSQGTKDDLTYYYSAKPCKIKVIPHGSIAFEIEKQNPDCKQDEFEKLKPFLFYIGRLEKRKNIERIIKAFIKLKEEGNDFSNLKLVLAGSGTDYFEKLKKDLIRNSKFKNEIIELGYVSDDKAYCLMKNASIFIFPSLAEGFGMPLLDAEYLGIPLVTSNLLPLKEIARSKTVLLNQLSSDEIVLGIKKAFVGSFDRNEKIDFYNFSFEKAAKETIKVLSEDFSQ